MSTLDDVRRFYGAFSTRLLADYAHGNARIDAAIQHTVRWIPTHARRVLDVGCGIGHSTAEIKRQRRVTTAVGVDLSEASIGIARMLFSENGLTFFDHDISSSHPVFNDPFDAVVMLDVYEHIPRQLRDAVHTTLSKAMAARSILIVTGPTQAFQEFLRTNRPDSLQRVDEDVTPDDLSRLATDVGGSLIFYQPVTIWRPTDYFHAVIERMPSGVARPRDAHPGRHAGSLESLRTRRRRIAERLRVRVTRAGVTMPDRGDPVVCVVAPSAAGTPETFIRTHLERLPVSTRFLYGGWFPCLVGDDDSPLLPSAGRFLTRAVARVVGAEPGRVHTAAFRAYPAKLRRYLLSRYFHQEQVRAVVAEYGTTAATLAPVCAGLRIPLIAYFHGFDAYETWVLDRFAAGYRFLFQHAAGIVAVSRHMESQLISLGAPRDRLHYIPYGVDESLFNGSEPALAPPLFVAVGRFVDKKAPHLTLLAFSKVLGRVRDARLVMIGDGPLLESCRKLAVALGIAEAVDFLGTKPHAEIADMMRRARGFLQHSVRPSHGDMEGTPLALLEANASGLPAVVTRHGGISDVVVDGETGFLVDECDVTAMASGIIRLAEQPDLAGTLGRAARERILRHFSLDRMVANLWQVIDRAISTTDPAIRRAL